MDCRLVSSLTAGLAVVGLLGLTAVSHSADSQLPDDDQSGANNSMVSAINLGTLGLVDGDQRRGASYHGVLGVVATGFDSVDFFRFDLPFGNWSVHVQLEEWPDFTLFAVVKRSNGQNIWTAIENANEDFTLEDIQSGTYFIAVFADASWAKGRKLEYDLTIAPDLIPNRDVAGTGCSNAADLGLMSSQGAILNGSLGPQNSHDTYGFYVDYGFSVAVLRFHDLTDNEVSIVDLNSRRSFPLAHANEHSGDIHYRTFDPGFYCLMVQATGLPVDENYSIQLLTGPNPDGPRGTRDLAGSVAFYDLGNLSANGDYPLDSSRYVARRTNSFPPQNLVPSHEYVIRDWVGPTRPEQWLVFELQDRAKLDIRFSNLFDSMAAELQSEDGQVLGVATTSGASLDDHLPPMQLVTLLSPGKYYVKVNYAGLASTGTNYSMVAKTQTSMSGL